MKFYRGMILASLLAFAGVASAQSYPTVTQLQTPANLVGTYQHSCIAGGFRADDSVYGSCTWLQYGVCSGRGCQPVRYAHNYTVSWDLSGNATSSVACDIVRTHAPQVPQITYLNGNTDCPVYAANPLRSVTYVPYGPYSWDYVVYYFVAISDDGNYTLTDHAVVYPATAQVPQS